MMLSLLIFTSGAPTRIAYLFFPEMGFIMVLSLSSPMRLIFFFMMMISL